MAFAAIDGRDLGDRRVLRLPPPLLRDGSDDLLDLAGEERCAALWAASRPDEGEERALPSIPVYVAPGRGERDAPLLREGAHFRSSDAPALQDALNVFLHEPGTFPLLARYRCDLGAAERRAIAALRDLQIAGTDDAFGARGIPNDDPVDGFDRDDRHDLLVDEPGRSDPDRPIDRSISCLNVHQCPPEGVQKNPDGGLANLKDFENLAQMTPDYGRQPPTPGRAGQARTRRTSLSNQ